MVKSVTIKNIVKNTELEIAFENPVFVLNSIDWDSPSVFMESYRVPFQIGESLSGVTVGVRMPTITGYVVADKSKITTSGKSWEDYFKEQEQQIEESKLVLDRLISVYQDVIIQVGEYLLEARPTQAPKYATTYEENNEVMCFFSIQFECYKPLFYKNSKIVDLAVTTGKFHFPLIIPQDEKLIFGEIMQRQSINIENSGDVDAGCVIKVSANGGVVKDPKVYNVNTGEFIGFENVTLQDGDYITITTDVGEENAIKHESETAKDVSVVGNITKGSKFIRIQLGSSFYAYDVEEEYRNNIEVSVMFTEKYFNIRGM